MRRPTVALAGLALLAAAVVADAGPDVAGGAADVAPTAVRTMLGPGVLAGPGGIALDAAGNLFVADTGHCRVLVVPARSGLFDGLRVRAGRAATLAGGSCTGPAAFGHPSDVAVDGRGNVLVAEATSQRVQEVRAGSRTVVTVAGTGTAGFNGDVAAATAGELDEPTGVAVNAAGDVFIADTANCRVRVVPAATTVALFGLAVHGGGLYTVAGTGLCGSSGQGGPLRSSQLWNPVAVTLDAAGDLLVADSGDQSVLLAPSGGGTFYGSAIGTGDIGVVVGGTGSYGPYVADGLPANGPTAELNDPRGLAIGPAGALFVTDGFMHVIRVVPAADETLLGRTLRAGHLYTVAGALPGTTAAGTNDGTRWVRTHVGTPVGVAVSATGTLYDADSTEDTVRLMSTGTSS